MSQPPVDLRCHCALCPTVTVGLEAWNQHLRDAHPEQWTEPERWPDGALVLHAPDVEPEDL